MIKISKMQYMTTAQIQKVEAACALANRVLVDSKFLEELSLISSFASAPGVNGQDVAKKLATDVSVSLYVYSMPWYRRWSSEICRESNGQVGIRNTYLASATLAQLANSLVHESLHAYGYSHDFMATAQRPMSVPYRVGELIEKYAAL